MLGSVATLLVECLNCGATRKVASDPVHGVQPGACAKCGYVGWADHESLSETLRRALRDQAPPTRRIAAW
jgi:hypothetical protein